MAEIDELIEAKNRLSMELLRSRKRQIALPVPPMWGAHVLGGRSLHAVGVGRKLVEGKSTSTLCVRLYVVQKLPRGLIPVEARLPKSIAGFPTDVIESPVARFHAAPCSVQRRRRQRPICGGISAAHRDVLYRATLGCFCRSLRKGEESIRFILGCTHAFANLGAAVAGEPILQPARGDGGRIEDQIARLSRWVPIQLGYTPNLVDAAIAMLLPKILASNKICAIGPLPRIAPAKLGMTVCKHGRTTGYTKGEVVDPSMDPYVVDYATGTFATFVNQIGIVGIPGAGYQAPPSEMAWNDWFAAPGDSGSLIVDKTSRAAVGLHFAGEAGFSVSNPIADVCRLLEIAIP